MTNSTLKLAYTVLSLCLVLTSCSSKSTFPNWKQSVEKKYKNKDHKISYGESQLSSDIAFSILNAKKKARLEFSKSFRVQITNSSRDVLQLGESTNKKRTRTEFYERILRESVSFELIGAQVADYFIDDVQKIVHAVAVINIKKLEANLNKKYKKHLATIQTRMPTLTTCSNLTHLIEVKKHLYALDKLDKTYSSYGIELNNKTLKTVTYREKADHCIGKYSVSIKSNTNTPVIRKKILSKFTNYGFKLSNKNEKFKLIINLDTKISKVKKEFGRFTITGITDLSFSNSNHFNTIKTTNTLREISYKEGGLRSRMEMKLAYKVGLIMKDILE